MADFKETQHGRNHLEHGSDPIRGLFYSPRFVWGAVFNDGGVIAGTGFSVVWDSAHSYTVTFDEPFTNPPVVLLAGNNDNAPGGVDGRYIVSLLTRAADHVVVITQNADDPDSLSLQDGGFDFVCIEPGV